MGGRARHPAGTDGQAAAGEVEALVEILQKTRGAVRFPALVGGGRPAPAGKQVAERFSVAQVDSPDATIEALNEEARHDLIRAIFRRVTVHKDGGLEFEGLIPDGRKTMPARPR